MRETLTGAFPIPMKQTRRIVAALLFASAGVACSLTVLATPSETAPTPTPHLLCQLRVLIAYADSAPPTKLQSQILAEPGVIAVDLFDATIGTPTLAQLQQYQIVVPLSNDQFFNSITLGDNLVDYVDGGGVVVQYGISFMGPGTGQGINGRWFHENYYAYGYHLTWSRIKRLHWAPSTRSTP